MQNLITKGFDGPKGLKAVFSFRPGTADENTILATYKEDEYGFVNFQPQAGDAMIDAGGYVGSTAILYAQLFPEARIFCLEPLPENVEIIRKNIEANHLGERIILIERALWGNSTDKIKVHYRDSSTVGAVHRFVGSAFPDYHETVSTETAEVQTISLDDIIRDQYIRNVRLLKMDIEGSEFEVLRGLSEENLLKIQTMVGEYHNVKRNDGSFARHALYELCKYRFANHSKGPDTDTWGPFLFERID